MMKNGTRGEPLTPSLSTPANVHSRRCWMNDNMLGSKQEIKARDESTPRIGTPEQRTYVLYPYSQWVKLLLNPHQVRQHKLMHSRTCSFWVRWFYIKFVNCTGYSEASVDSTSSSSTYSRIKIRVQMLVQLSFLSEFSGGPIPIHRSEILVTPLYASGRNCIPKWDPVLRSAPACTQRQSREAQAIWRLGHDSSDRSICHLVPDSSDPNSVS